VEALIERAGLGEISAKVRAGERLSLADGLALERSADLTAVGCLANRVRERLNGRAAYFVVNQHINYTNVCFKDCLFCSFAAREGDPRAYTMSVDEVRAKARARLDEPIREIHMVGGINPRLPYQYYLDIVAAVKAIRPEVHVKAYTMIEIAEMARVGRRAPEQVFRDLRAAGLDSHPGGGVEVLSDRVHRALFHKKLSGSQWLDLARTAHRVGLPTNATLLYGHIETDEERVAHFVRLRELQDETGGFLAFIPLAFHPEHTGLDHIPHTTGVLDLRVIALARLMLDNFQHIKTFWIMNTAPVSQVALWYGADDIDGTIAEYEITRDPVTDTKQALTRQQMMDLVREVGRVPIERDALYRPVGEMAEVQL
jgi:aminodeoxyfutalosine synthase